MYVIIMNNGWRKSRILLRPTTRASAAVRLSRFFHLLILLLVLLLLSLESPVVNGQRGLNKFSGIKSTRVVLPPPPPGEQTRRHSNQLRRSRVGPSSHGKSGRSDYTGDDMVFGGEKRRVHTGPNPLHNR